MKLGTLYGGFGGFDIGAKAAGSRLTWSIEKEPRIADVARTNLGAHVVTGDVTTIDPASLPRVEHLHASPPCPNFSKAKANSLGGTEQPEDVAHARAIASYIDEHQPKIFTLENVVGYRGSESIRIIMACLTDGGYLFDLNNICASRFGVPQTRLRLLIRAVRGGLVPPLHLGKSEGCWLRAISDIADGLVDTEFADWQLPKRPPNSPVYVLTGTGTSDTVGYRLEGQPAFTVTASQKAAHRAKLPSGRIVKMSTSCLARWQTFPDWYELPARATLAGRGIGNAVPPMLAERIVSGLLNSMS